MKKQNPAAIILARWAEIGITPGSCLSAPLIQAMANEASAALNDTLRKKQYTGEHKKVLTPEQLRLCLTISDAGEIDTVALAAGYIDRDRRPGTTHGIICILKRLSERKIIQGRPEERILALGRRVRTLWSLTELGNEFVKFSARHYEDITRVPQPTDHSKG